MPPACYLPPKGERIYYLGIVTVSPIQKANVQLKSPFNLFVNTALFFIKTENKPKGELNIRFGQLVRGQQALGGEKNQHHGEWQE